MGNRRKSTNPYTPPLIREKALHKVDIPSSGKVVLKTVPAKLHFKDILTLERDDTEVIGETIIYEDGTMDVIVFEDISADARSVLYSFSDYFSDYFSIEETQDEPIVDSSE